MSPRVAFKSWVLMIYLPILPRNKAGTIWLFPF